MQLLQSNRRGQAQSALRAVQGRHEAIQKIERQMEELAQLFQDVEAAVVEQEPAVVDIETKAENTNTNVGKANVEIDGAIDSARARNRKKWWCLLIVCELNPVSKMLCAGTLLTLDSNNYCRHRRDRSRRNRSEEKLSVASVPASCCCMCSEEEGGRFLLLHGTSPSLICCRHTSLSIEPSRAPLRKLRAPKPHLSFPPPLSFFHWSAG